MKGKKYIAFSIASALLSLGVYAFFKFRKRNEKETIERQNDYDYNYEDKCDYCDYGVYKFDNVEDMYKAIDSNEINIDCSCSIDNKGYIIAVLDGNESKISYYGGKELTQIEMDDLFEKFNMNTMYFYFPNDEYLYGFCQAIASCFEDNVPPIIVDYDGKKYIDLSKADINKQKYLRALAQEFFAIEIRRGYMADELEKVFDFVRNN